MLGVAAFIGFTVGWFCCWASDQAGPQAVQHGRRVQRLTAALNILTTGYWPVRKNGWSWLHRGVILVSAVVFAYLWQRFGLSWETFRLAASFGFLVLIALIDLKFRRIPNRLVYPAIIVTVLYQALVLPEALVEAVVGGGMAFLIFYLTAWLRPGDLGGGDIKLAALIGIGFGFPGVVWALLVGAGLGAAVAIVLIFIWRWNAKSGIPYAPFLCVGAWVAIVYNPLPLFLHG